MTKARRVDDDLAVALRLAEPHARRLVFREGIHPDPKRCDGGAIDAAEALAGVRLTDDDGDRFHNTITVAEHAYVLGVAVGLKLRGCELRESR